MGIFYRPTDGFAADFIPFFWKGDYHLFYLKDYRGQGELGRASAGTPWFHLVTRDFVHFEDWGEAIPRGGEDDYDKWVFTGSVFHHAGVFHIFYTGHNPALKAKGRRMQLVMHATSPDLRIWTKDKDFLFDAPEGYEPDDWRDPFIFHDEKNGGFGMLLAARLKSVTPGRNRGCVALATSPDLTHWTVREPFWAPDEYYTHECPDLFRVGRHWYLIFSEFSERSVTHYRIANTQQGPWRVPANPDGGDTFDARTHYAAKTASDGRRRFSFGWLPTRHEEKDTGSYQWGGELVVHEISQSKSGTLTVKPPREVLAAFKRRHPLTPGSPPGASLGPWRTGKSAITTQSAGRHSMLLLGGLPDEALIETKVQLLPGAPPAAGVGLLLRCNDVLETYYVVRVEPHNQRVVFDRWPRPGDHAFQQERPVAIKPSQPITLRAIVSGSCLVVYVNDKVALSTRMYEHRAGAWGLFVTEGNVRFSATTIKTRA